MRSVPQIVSMVAIVIGIVLFIVTLIYIDLEETLDTASRLGLSLPVILVPGTFWQVLRTWGWAIAFPDAARPPFTRLLRVRLAADAIAFFTIRGLAGEPLKVVLLYDRVAPEVTTAAVALERLAFAVIGIVIAALISLVAVTRLSMPGAWDTVFRLLILAAIVILTMAWIMARRRPGDYLGRLVAALDRATRRRLGTSRAIRFILAVEDVLLQLLRGDRRRLVILTALAVCCYGLMAVEVWLVFWAIGRPIGIIEGLAVETFARLASVASAAIPGNIGALEASNAAVVGALGLAGGGALALARRIRALLWAAAGLAVYPRVQKRRQ
ncbi:MAG: flippase-like domain-containing protein [Acidobacteria bacterium]|nr:flippase-like domain-containing protein [Acidobacteriota bacterium]